ncbi:hypothetical protein LAZ67_1005908 [Cordylochernes scorpioides]|uniref:peptidyl-tRNA hydrolase n=1 Tax=Cordylochernes scorpioides TaxID=51811 RepID=A0ABY6K1Z9_9ARAC|nr:hypothetical protein LAZ67_1005908 [Cordylochernes scorpioides]
MEGPREAGDGEESPPDPRTSWQPNEEYLRILTGMGLSRNAATKVRDSPPVVLFPVTAVLSENRDYSTRTTSPLTLLLPGSLKTRTPIWMPRLAYVMQIYVLLASHCCYMCDSPFNIYRLCGVPLLVETDVFPWKSACVNQEDGVQNDELEEEEDEVRHKMVFVANCSLAMGVGKLAAQVAHAALGLSRLLAQDEDKYGTMVLHWIEYGYVESNPCHSIINLLVKK